MLLAVLLATVANSAIEPRRGPIHYAVLVDNASVICIGTVDRLRTIELPAGAWKEERHQPLTFGHIQVERMIKGAPETKELWHEAWLSGVEDATQSRLGERCLFLLAPGRIETASPEPVRRLVLAEFGTVAVLRGNGFGDGVAPIHDDGDGEYVSVSAPLRLRAPRDRFPQFSSRLESVLDYTTTLMHFSPENVRLRASCTTSPELGCGFELRVLEDGSYRLATPSFSVDEVITLDRLSDERWRELRDSLTRILPRVPLTLTADLMLAHGRHLDIRLGTAALEFAEEGLEPERLDPDDQGTYRAALRCWAEIRALLTQTGLADHRVQDKSWLDKH